MGKGATTRDAIVNEALRQASRLGLEGLSLAPLADSLKLSKSGLFAHFKSKEALQLGILDEAIARFTQQVVLPNLDEADPERRLSGLFVRYLDWIRGTDEDGGCLFMTVAQEFDDRPGPIRDRLAASQREWRRHLADVLRDGAAAGRFRADLDADQVVFELIGAAFSFHHAAKLLDDPNARMRAVTALDHILESIRR